MNLFETFLKKVINNPQVMERIRICDECDHLDKNRNQCRHCGCDIKFKILVPFANCPINKW